AEIMPDAGVLIAPSQSMSPISALGTSEAKTKSVPKAFFLHLRCEFSFGEDAAPTAGRKRWAIEKDVGSPEAGMSPLASASFRRSATSCAGKYSSDRLDPTRTIVPSYTLPGMHSGWLNLVRLFIPLQEGSEQIGAF